MGRCLKKYCHFFSCLLIVDRNEEALSFLSQRHTEIWEMCSNLTQSAIEYLILIKKGVLLFLCPLDTLRLLQLLYRMQEEKCTY